MGERLVIVYTFENDLLEFKAGWKDLSSAKIFDFIDKDMSIEKILSLIEDYFKSKYFECFVEGNTLKTEDDTILCVYEASPEAFKILCQEEIVPKKDGSLYLEEEIMRVQTLRKMSIQTDFVCAHFKYEINNELVDAYMYVPEKDIVSFEEKTIRLTEPFYRIYYFKNNLPKTENNASRDVLLRCNP